MSSNKTEHLNLHAWEPMDQFVREEFNENFAHIDAQAGRDREEITAAQATADTASATASAALSLAETALQAAQTAQSTADASLRIQFGSYVGTQANKTAADPMVIDFDFVPKIVFMFPRPDNKTQKHTIQYNTQPASQPSVLVLDPEMTSVTLYHVDGQSTYELNLIWSGKSLKFYRSGNAIMSLNVSGVWYHWIAIG